MNALHEQTLAREIGLARGLMARGRLEGAFFHLQRAHVLGQRDVRWHVLTHWLLLALALRRRQGRAAVGQMVRIVLGAIGSAVGRVPTGNTGGSDVSLFAPMPTAPELLAIREGPSPDRRASGHEERSVSWRT